MVCVEARFVDPDFSMTGGGASPIYSPLSEQHLRMSGQRGLQVGDIIVGVNGESVMRVPDIHMLLRGTAGRSVRLGKSLNCGLHVRLVGGSLVEITNIILTFDLPRSLLL